MQNFTIHFENGLTYPLADMSEDTLLFKTDDLTQSQDVALHGLFLNYEPIIGHIDYPDGSTLSIKFKIRKFERNEVFKILTIEREPMEKLEFPDHLSVSVGSCFFDYMVSNNASKETTYKLFKSNGWTDEQMIDAGYLSTIEPKQSKQSIEFIDIKDNLDFIELVGKFSADYSLRGGQLSNGTWFLKGEK